MTESVFQKTYQYFKKMSKVLTDTLAKLSQNIFAYFSVSEHSASFSLHKTKPILVADRGLTPPPLTDKSATNRFFNAFPKGYIKNEIVLEIQKNFKEAKIF